MMDEFIQIISNVGFPIAMCLYFMLRMEKVLNNNTKAILKLVERVK